MKSIICLIIFHTVFGKNFLVEVEDDPKENELSSDEKFEAELSNPLDKDMPKTAGNDYTRVAEETACRGLLHKKRHLRWM